MEDLKQETTMEELNNEIEVVEEEEEVYKPKTEEEKAKEIKYNSDGERLVYIGNDCWVPENAIPTEQDLHEYYARFARPRIYPLSIIWNILIPLLLSAGIVCALKFVFDVEWFQETKNCILASIIFVGAYALLRLKDLMVFAIKLYQRFAPQHVRERCVFTPTCSDYTIISLNKYGIIVGGIRSIGRLRRCKFKNGGYDYP